MNFLDFRHYNQNKYSNKDSKKFNQNCTFNYLCHSRYCTACDEYEQDHKYRRIPDLPSRQNNNNKAYCAVKLVNHHATNKLPSLAPVTNSVKKYPSLSAAACIDTGNLFGTCVSTKVAKALKLDLAPVKQQYVGLASSAAKTKILGRSKYPVELRFGTHTTCLLYTSPSPRD